MIIASELLTATAETIYMVSVSSAFAALLGLPLGILLFVTQSVRLQPRLYRVLNGFINISRSIPFIILLVALIPFTRLLIGTSIGINAAIVPLSLGAMPFFARLADLVFQRIPSGLIETTAAMGATTWQTIWHCLLPEGLPGIIQAFTVTVITLVNYSAMAGAVGGGGLGDLAIRYGYQRFDLTIMTLTIALLILLVQLIQYTGDSLSQRVTHE